MNIVLSQNIQLNLKDQIITQNMKQNTHLMKKLLGIMLAIPLLLTLGTNRLHAQNFPPYFTNTDSICGAIFIVNEGETISFTVSAADSNVTDVVDLSSNALPAGASMTPDTRIW